MPRLKALIYTDGTRKPVREGTPIRGGILSRHPLADDGCRCQRCGQLWPCDNEVGWLRAVSRGQELAKEHGW